MPPVGDCVQLVAHEDRRNGQRCAAAEAPGDLRVRDVAPAGRADGEQHRLVEAGREVDEPVAVDRPGDVGEAPRVLDPPDLAARRRFVRRRPEGADVDDLVGIPDANRERRGVCLRNRGGPHRPPPLLAGSGVDGDQEGSVVAVDAHDQQPVVEDRRAAVPVLRRVGEAGAPQHLAAACSGGGDGRGALGAEVDMDPFAVRIDDRRRRGEAVLLVQERRVGDGEHLDVHRGIACGRVVGEQSQRRGAGVAISNRGGEPDPPAADDRRRPAPARDWRFPGDVLRFAPGERNRLVCCVSLPGRPAKLRPVGRRGRTAGDEREDESGHPGGA